MSANLKITQDESNEKCIFRIEGRLDASSSVQLESVMNKTLEKDCLGIILDFSKVEYLSSAGMRLLLSFTKKLAAKGGKLVIFAVHEEVMEIIKMAGFEKILCIYPTQQKAVESL